MFKLFKRKPRLDSADPQDRIAALAALDDGEQETFARFFLEDGPREVRVAALARLARLEPLVDGLSDDAVAEPAAARLLALIDENTPESIRRHPRVLAAAMENAETPAGALDVAAWTENAHDRAVAMCRNPRAAVRAAVAEATWEPAMLAELEKCARGRDKNVHRIARDRLAMLRAARADRAQQEERTEKLLEAALTLDASDPHYDARRDAIERDWSKILAEAEATDAQLAKFGIASRDPSAARRFPPRREPPPVAAPAAGADFEPLLAQAEALRDAVTGLAADELGGTAVADRKRSAEAIAARWDAEVAAELPEASLAKRFQDAMAAVQRGIGDMEDILSLTAAAEDILRGEVPDVEGADFERLEACSRETERQIAAIDRLLAGRVWTKDRPPPGAVGMLQERRGVLADAAQQCQKRVNALAEEITALVAQVRDSVASGAAHEASEGDRRLRDLVRLLPRDKARRFQSELAEIGASVRELRDWRTFAETPKRKALCEQIEALAAEPLEVHEQIEAVKSLRSQWNALSPADSHGDRELRKRFDRAAERAFEPCRAYFKAQAEQRTFNLEQRRAIVAALEGYLEDNDWEQADWRGVERVLRQARAEWRQYHPVDRKAGRDVANRFEELAGRLHELLKNEWDRNIERKQAIVAEATQVRESGDPATVKADAMKGLQRRWKQVGPVPRRVDQRLWKLFRDECEVVFADRNAIHDRHSRRRRAIDEAEGLIGELARRVDIDPGLNRNTVAEYEHRLHELGDLPNELKRRIDAALREADRTVAARQMAAAAHEAGEP